MKKVIFIFLVSISVISISCSYPLSPLEEEKKEESNEIPEVPENYPIAPPEMLTGRWTGSFSYGYSSAIGEFKYFRYESYTFNDDNTYKRYVSIKKWGISQDKYSTLYDIKYENARYYKRLHDNQFSSWKVIDIREKSYNQLLIDGSITFTKSPYGR